MSTGFTRLPDPVKSENDKRHYRAIKLNNGLKVLLISYSGESSNVKTNELLGDGQNEENDEKAAAALSVQVGTFSDPHDLGGLAHFLEHMLFMGSEKYPDENGYDAFIKKHGGSDNAHTEAEFTVYQFEVNNKKFKEALDIFSQFFIAPLMKKDSMDRELKAVDSEYRLAYPDDGWRKIFLSNSMAKDGNPFRNFGVGNLESLKILPEKQGVNVHSRLHAFWKNYYSAHLMTLCVISKDSLDTLQNWVVDIFSKIEKKNIRAPAFEGHEKPFDTPIFHKLYKASSIEQTKSLNLMWSLRSLVKDYKAFPLRYIMYILGQEGRGSILDYLKKRVWATSITCGNSNTNQDHNSLASMFSIGISLTDAGFEHVDDILLVVFQYLDMFKRHGPQKSKFDEYQALEEMNFKFKDEEDPDSYVASLCYKMQIFNVEDVLKGGEMMLKFDEGLIRECIDALRPDNCNIIIWSNTYEKGHPCDQTEKWLQVPYKQEDIPTSWVKSWKNPLPNKELHLPEPNKFIATDFTLKNVEPEYIKDAPIKLKGNNSMRLWYKKDTKFLMPKGFILVHLKSPLTKCSPQNAVLLDMFICQLVQNFDSEGYAAKEANLAYEIAKEANGIRIRVSEFNQKLPVLLSTILDYLLKFDVNEEMFEGLKDQFLEAYYNDFIQPSQLCTSMRLSVLELNNWTSVEKRAMIETLTLQSLKSFWEQLIGNLFAEIMVHGNFTPQDALEIADIVQQKLKYKPITPEMLPQLRTVKIRRGQRTLRVMSFNSDDTNSSVTNYYQLGSGTIYLCCMNQLLLNIMEEPCFDQLRTKEQLGYDVSCNTRSTYGVLGYVVSVKSPADKYSCSHLDQRIESFLDGFQRKIADMSEEEFSVRVSSLIKTKNIPDLNMGEEAIRNWSEIVDATRVFDRIKRDTECLQKLKIKEFKKWAADVMNKNSVRKLSIQIVGQGDKAISECIPFKEKKIPSGEMSYDLQYFHCTQSKKETFVKEIAKYKRSLPVYPVARIIN